VIGANKNNDAASKYFSSFEKHLLSIGGGSGVDGKFLADYGIITSKLNQ
jgi:hypothetical protein